MNSLRPGRVNHVERPPERAVRLSRRLPRLGQCPSILAVPNRAQASPGVRTAPGQVSNHMSKASDVGQRACHTASVGGGRRLSEAGVQALTLTAALGELAVQIGDLSGETFPVGLLAVEQAVSVRGLHAEAVSVAEVPGAFLERGGLTLSPAVASATIPSACALAAAVSCAASCSAAATRA